MKAGSNKDTASRTCGNCGMTFRMRDDASKVLCTAILGVMDAGFEDVCEHYVERVEYPESRPPD